jgi:opacity protein-like surface antigen
MRRLLLLCMLAAALAVPVAASASGGDTGTLSVKNATGLVSVAARGVLLGHCGRCSVTITDPDPGDGSAPVVLPLSVLRTSLSDTRTAYQGNDLRFKLIGGFFRIRIVGTGIDVSVVADGNVVLDNGSAGTYSRNGNPYLPMPSFKVPLQLVGD